MKIKSLLILSLVLGLAIGFTVAADHLSPIPGAGVAQAATANPSPASSGYTPLVIPLMGQYTTSRTALVKFTALNGYRVIAANATARASGGTSPTLKIRGLSGVQCIYSSSGAFVAGTTKALTLATTPKIVDESAATIDLVIGGTSPVWSDISILLFLKRL